MLCSSLQATPFSYLTSFTLQAWHRCTYFSLYLWEFQKFSHYIEKSSLLYLKQNVEAILALSYLALSQTQQLRKSTHHSVTWTSALILLETLEIPVASHYHRSSVLCQTQRCWRRGSRHRNWWCNTAQIQKQICHSPPVMYNKFSRSMEIKTAFIIWKM